ncbi:hypothetical protein M440DRAFT_77396 [Trichoderma longibrachiatum ATCC 18648]|uniref:Uncharacterized protein n=1 Tax=Trichoderma longibrachiatum ATCC 18648 TaxID=983965 RepID=A0A2T4CHT9_TRILO|nr:hypothetical protein M440DRAFT_77396 [Trichoderma longibrachiatum ATCC 18648]
MPLLSPLSRAPFAAGWPYRRRTCSCTASPRPSSAAANHSFGLRASARGSTTDWLLRRGRARTEARQLGSTSAPALAQACTGYFDFAIAAAAHPPARAMTCDPSPISRHQKGPCRQAHRALFALLLETSIPRPLHFLCLWTLSLALLNNPPSTCATTDRRAGKASGSGSGSGSGSLWLCVRVQQEGIRFSAPATHRIAAASASPESAWVLSAGRFWADQRWFLLFSPFTSSDQPAGSSSSAVLLPFFSRFVIDSRKEDFLDLRYSLSSCYGFFFCEDVAQSILSPDSVERQVSHGVLLLFSCFPSLRCHPLPLSCLFRLPAL